MKSIKLNIRILIASLVAMLMGCEDTFLKETNYNKITPGDYIPQQVV